LVHRFCCSHSTTLATQAALVAVPAANREAHVSIWAMGAGLATAFGSELW
jgi:hypothetical protein